MIEQLFKIKAGSFIVKEASSGDITELLNRVDKANNTKATSFRPSITATS